MTETAGTEGLAPQRGEIMEEPHKNNTVGGEVYRPLPPTPTISLKMSSMEEECVRDRLRTSLLKQCSDILKADGATRYTRDAFRRLFQDKVGPQWTAARYRTLQKNGPLKDSSMVKKLTWYFAVSSYISLSSGVIYVACDFRGPVVLHSVHMF